MMNDRPREFESEKQEYNFYAKQIVLKEFAPIHRAIRHNMWININAQYLLFLKALPKLVDLKKFDLTEQQWADFIEKTTQSLKQRQISAAGISIYLYLYDLLTGKRGERDIRYVFVDEVQDYDAFQLAYLKFSFPNARFTLLGDLNQAIFTGANSRQLLRQLGTMFDPEKTKVVQLTKSYRSTKQITDFTKHVLKDGEKIEAFERQGELPSIYQLADVNAATSQVISVLEEYQKQHDAVAIIGKTLSDSEQIYQLLTEQGIKATLIRTENQRLVDGILVVPSYLAKGLEFDAVIVWDANEQKYRGDGERQLLYTICSRAMHALTIISVGQASHLFDDVPASEYELIDKK